MAKALLLTFLAAQAVGFLPLSSVVCFDSTFYGRLRPWWFAWGLWVLAVACAVYLGPEATRSWKRLDRGFTTSASGMALYLTGLLGIIWGIALSLNLALIMG